MSKKKTLSLLFGALLLLLIASYAFAIPTSDASANAYDIAYDRFEATEFTQLSYGIYWYQSGSDIPVAANKATNFDPSKPTIVYTHGMKALHEGLEGREGLSLKGNNNEYMTGAGFEPYIYEDEFHQALIEKGYNVGVFYWNQLADCDFTEDYKFWVPNIYSGMRYTYIKEDGQYGETDFDDETNPTCSVTALYRDTLIEALGKDFSGHLQLVGHSMGGQLTLAVSQALCVDYDNGAISSRFLPDRVTLLDPYLGATQCFGTVDTTGEKLQTSKYTSLLAAEAAENVANHGIPIEAYGANNGAYDYFSIIKDKDQVRAIRKMFNDNIAWVYLGAMIKTYSGFIPSHTMAVDYYFSTVYMDPQTDDIGVVVPSFNVSDDDIRRLKGVAFRQEYNEEVEKPNPIYMHDSSFIQIDGATKAVVTSEELSTALSGTVTETEKRLTVKMCKEEEVVAETKTLKGKYLFTDVEAGTYTLSFYYNNKKVGESQPIDVTASDKTVKVEETETIIKASNAAKPQSDNSKTIIWISVGAAALVLLIIIIVAIKRKNG